jgi:hypothetical protein
MVFKKKFAIAVGLFLLFLSAISATDEQIRVEVNEYVNQTVHFNPLKYIGTSHGIWADMGENQSFYDLVGYINVSNQNPMNRTISDIYVQFDNTNNITLPTLFSGRVGTFILNDTVSNSIVLHIPELRGGENSVWIYGINTSAVSPPINFTTEYTVTKTLAGDNFTVTDSIENVFNNLVFQTDTCIYDINLTQTMIPVNFSGTLYDFLFSGSTVGVDNSNVTYSDFNRVQNWNLLGGNCFFKGDSQEISYNISTPYNIPATTDYPFSNTVLEYKMDNTISHLKVQDITALSEAKIEIEKQILYAAHPTLFGSNVTWNVTALFETSTNITYNITSLTLWVAQRSIISGDPNTIDNDTISGDLLRVDSTPNELVNNLNPWVSPSWLFNYSDLPSPIVYMDVGFKIDSDGTQLINRSFTQNGNDIYIKEIYLILGYWLEIEKNISSVGNDLYNVKIDVHNKGNQVTPADSLVTVYDFIPSNFAVVSPYVYSASPWYLTAYANHSVNGTFNGSLFQWGIVPSNSLNTSFDAGPDKNENTTWSVEFNLTGQGDYTLLDVFVTGLDPQQVDGAGSTKSVVVSEVVDRIGSTEGIFATIASVLLLLGLLL